MIRSVVHQELADAVLGSPSALRTAIDLPKPKDWQAFQRHCRVLFQCELDDPHIQDYGRNGQNQHGIDLLGRRNGDPNHQVGIQCRNYAEPVQYEAISKDCRRAVMHFGGMREIIFATTAPNDTHATDAAERVERELGAEGHNVRVVIYGWGQLQELIARHDEAFLAFFPFTSGSPIAQQQAALVQGDDAGAVAAALLPFLAEGLRHLQSSTPLTPSAPEAGSADTSAEDPALHARIDVFRDMMRDGALLEAERRLLALLDAGGLEGKPWAHFRILTNLGSIALYNGKESEASARYEAAYALRPATPSARANLALVRTLEGRFHEAMGLAQEALSGTPRPEHAVTYLLQAAARSDWEGEPESLIPGDLAGTAHADIGLAEFHRRRNLPGWQMRCIELARRHQDAHEFKPINAVAVLSLAVESGATLSGGLGPVTAEDLTRAADDMKEHVERMLKANFADEHDQHAHLNNACVLLRICGRHEEVEALLRRAGPTVSGDPVLRRLMALALIALGRREEALDRLDGDADAENVFLRAELGGRDEPAAALDQVLTVSPHDLSPLLVSIRLHLIAELSLRAGRLDALEAAVASLRSLEPSDPAADVFALRGERHAGLPEDEFRSRLRELGQRIPQNASMSTRYFLAQELCDANCSEEGSRLLDGHVDLSRVTPAAVLYLQALAEARRDDAFRAALAAASQVLREDLVVLSITATHAWNMGDLNRAYEAVSFLVERDPNDTRARLLRLEILLRQDRSAELAFELRQPLEKMSWPRLSDSFRLTSFLAHFGFLERAATFAYKLFLENRENPRAWMTLSGLVVGKGSGDADRTVLWEASAVGANVAVDLKFDDGHTQFFVVEADRHLRKLDDDAWEPEHPLVQRLMGLLKGARFADSSGREGVIAELRHKVVARFHYILQNYEVRFPDQQGFRSVAVAPEQPGGLDEMIAILKARSEWVKQEQEQYLAGSLPLSLLAIRLGLDTIEVSQGLASQGVKFKVALGIESERQDAQRALRDNGTSGCVLDLLAFWTAWRLGTLDVIVETCGRVHVGQQVMDRLRGRRERLRDAARDGSKSASYEDGRVVLREVVPEVAQGWLRDLDDAIAWLEGNATVCPLVAGDELPTPLREHLSLGLSDLYDSLIVAWRNRLLLITDDQPLRQIGKVLGFQHSCWSHAILLSARDSRRLGMDRYIKCTASLVEAGHNYIGVAGYDLVTALRMDAAAGEMPGHNFELLSKLIGGKSAEPVSHARAVVDFLQQIWRDPATQAYRKAGTSVLLRRLISDRHEDYGPILRAVILSTRGNPSLQEFLLYWVRGHFIPQEKIWGESTQTSDSNDARLAGNGGRHPRRHKKRI